MHRHIRKNALAKQSRRNDGQYNGVQPATDTDMRTQQAYMHTRMKLVRIKADHSHHFENDAY